MDKDLESEHWTTVHLGLRQRGRWHHEFVAAARDAGQGALRLRDLPVPKLCFTGEDHAVVEAQLRLDEWPPGSRRPTLRELVTADKESPFSYDVKPSTLSMHKKRALKKTFKTIYYVAHLAPPGTFDQEEKIIHVLDMAEGITLYRNEGKRNHFRRRAAAVYTYDDDAHPLPDNVIACLAERADEIDAKLAWDFVHRAASGQPIIFPPRNTQSYSAHYVGQFETMAQNFIAHRQAVRLRPDGRYAYPELRRAK